MCTHNYGPMPKLYIQKNGNTAAHQCFRFKYNKLGTYLIDKGADIHLRNREGVCVFDMVKAVAAGTS